MTNIDEKRAGVKAALRNLTDSIEDGIDHAESELEWRAIHHRLAMVIDTIGDIIMTKSLVHEMNKTEEVRQQTLRMENNDENND